MDDHSHFNIVEDLKRYLSTPKDISLFSLEEQANVLTLHFIGYLAKPIGIDDNKYKKCLEAFSNSRGKIEWESEAVLNVLRLLTMEEK